MTSNPNPHGLADDLVHLPPSAINAERGERQRSGIDTEGLLASIRRNGIMKPLVVERGSHRLIAGERRLECARELGLPTVPVRYTDTLQPIERQILEFDENLKRQDLSWPDAVRAALRIHRLYLSVDPNWTIPETAAEMGVARPWLTVMLVVGGGLEEDSTLSECSNVREAYNRILRKQNRALGNAMAQLLEAGAGPEVLFGGTGEVQEVLEAAAGLSPPQGEALSQDEAGGDEPSLDNLVYLSPLDAPPGASPRALPDSVVCADFIHWITTYSGPKWNFLHCDFPYGIKVFDGDLMAGAEDERYEDSPDIYFALVRALATNLDRVMSISGHLMFWYSARHEAETKAIFAALAPTIEWSPYPLVWFKSDNRGIAGDYRKFPRHVYETALLGVRGSRHLVKSFSDCYAAPTDRSHHVSTKPEPMLRYFMSGLVDEHTTLLDPTCGGGSALRAAESLGATRVLGVEADPGHADTARAQLHKFRVLRTVGGPAGGRFGL